MVEKYNGCSSYTSRTRLKTTLLYTSLHSTSLKLHLTSHTHTHTQIQLNSPFTFCSLPSLYPPILYHFCPITLFLSLYPYLVILYTSCTKIPFSFPLFLVNHFSLLVLLYMHKSIQHNNKTEV